MKSTLRLSVCAIAFSASTVAMAAPTLTATTDNPTNSMFAVGASARATFVAKGWNAGERRAVVADVYDWRNEKVTTLTAALKADGEGSGAVTLALPTDRYGFFRVRAAAGDLKLPKCGTRPAGEFTYGVAMDPKDRPDIPQERAFMGIHGEACGQGRWMGAHQGFATYALTEKEYREACAKRAGDPWRYWGVARRKVPMELVNNDCSGPDAFQGEKDLAAEIGFGWNEDFLLIDALVKDDAYRQDNTGWWTWNGDAIQFGFARKKLERLTANDYTDSLAQGTTEIDFALTKNGPEGYRTISFDPYKWPTDMHGKGQIDPADCRMSIVKTETADGVELRYRIALPWRYLNKTEGARAGEQVFVSATFNDRDPGDKSYAAIKLFELKRLAPRRFGAVQLVRP